MVNVFAGLKDGKKKKIVVNLLIERDLKTGLMAMSLGVGYTASIVACMIASGEIKGKGVLSPATDVPYDVFHEAVESARYYARREDRDLGAKDDRDRFLWAGDRLEEPSRSLKGGEVLRGS